MRPGICKILLCAAVLAGLCAPMRPPVRAETANQIQALDFGHWFISSNASQHSVSVALDGGYTNSPALIMLRPPRPGIYNVVGLPVDTIINAVVVNPTENLSAGGSEEFTLDSFVVDFPSVTSNTGTATMTVGGTAHTSGSGSGYAPGVYSGELTLEIDINL